MVSIPRLPVGDITTSALEEVWRRVVNPDLPRWRRILTIAWPVVVTNFLQSLALTVDLIFVGSLGPEALAAAGLATQVFLLAMAVGAGLAAAATALVARAYGAGDTALANRAATTAMLLGAGLGLVLAVPMWLGAGTMMDLLGAGTDIRPGAARFLEILALGLPANFLMIAATGAFQGAADTRPTLWINIGVNVVNLVADWILIFGNLGSPALGLTGAALATMLSYTVGALFFLYLIWKGSRPLRVDISKQPTGDPLAVRFIRVGTPAAAEQLLLSLGFTLYLLLIVQFGTQALAAHLIGLRIQSFAFMPGFGFSAAAAAMVGQGLGRGDPKDAEESGWAAAMMALTTMVVFGIPLVLFSRDLAGLFTTDTAALGLGSFWTQAILVALPAISLYFAASGGLRGAGDTKFPLAVSFIGLFALRLPIAYLLGITMGYGIFGVWASYIIEYYARALLTLAKFRGGKWKEAAV
ncbi:MAG: MATE family efflux transporter [Euryarchaeota archaeon]|nr:MATE family efflux transporter [Euryarchaeota archaeon]